MANWKEFDALANVGEQSNVVHIDIEKVTHAYKSMSEEYVVVKVGGEQLLIGGDKDDVMQKLGIEVPIT